MKWVTLLLQLVSFRSSLLESRALLENARAAAEKGKRAALFSAFFLLALVYFLVGSILTIVELGLQYDRGLGFRFTGLLLASLALILIAALIGINVGNRKRYVEAIIDRSRQLLVERDQQAQLAARAERERIAREMHDIVSHSLTVVVALSEGAAGSGTPGAASSPQVHFGSVSKACLVKKSSPVAQELW